MKLIAQLLVCALQRGEMLAKLVQGNFETVYALNERGRFLGDF